MTTTPLNRRSDWSQIRKECEETSAAEVARRLDIPATTLRSALQAAAAEESSEDEPGYIYCLTNPSMPGLVKVGRSYDVPEVRAQQLSSSTAVPEPFELEFHLYTERSHATERAIHQALNESRLNHSREFFKVGPENLRALFSCLDESDDKVKS